MRDGTARGVGRLDEPVQEQLRLLEADPYQLDAYQALLRLYRSAHQIDKAWCVSAVLSYLSQADAEVSQLFERHRPTRLVRPKVPLTEELWSRYVCHPTEDRTVSALFAAVHRAIGKMKSVEHGAFGLKRGERLTIDPAVFEKARASGMSGPGAPADLDVFLRPEPARKRSWLAFLRREDSELAAQRVRLGMVFGFLMQVLDLPSNIQIFFRPEQPGELQVANTREKDQLTPSIVVGKDLLAGRSDKELAFPIGAFLAKMRPEHYLRQILPSNTELSVASQAAIRLVRPDFEALPQHTQLVEQYMTAVSPHLSSAAREHLERVAQKFITAGTQLDMAKWSQAVDLTAHRVGLILSSDLASAARSIEQESTTVRGMELKARLRELILYAISPAYFELRQHLGIAIG